MCKALARIPLCFLDGAGQLDLDFARVPARNGCFELNPCAYVHCICIFQTDGDKQLGDFVSEALSIDLVDPTSGPQCLAVADVRCRAFNQVIFRLHGHRDSHNPFDTRRKLQTARPTSSAHSAQGPVNCRICRRRI